MNRSANWLLASLYGAVAALVIGYGGSYLLTHLGFSIVNLPEGEALRGPIVLKLSALNLYAIQHISLVGAGKVVDPLGAGLVSARITLPLTVWGVIPALGLLIGGYAAAKLASGNRGAMTACAVVGGLLYAGILAGGSWLVQAKLGSFLLPEVEGIGANPPPVMFRPAVVSSLIYGSIFGMVFMYLGALVAMRARARGVAPGRWWACAKSIVVLGLVLQLLIAATGVLVLRYKADSQPVTTEIVEILPTTTGIAYGMLYGGTLRAQVTSRLQEGEEPQSLLNYSANLYRGVSRSAEGEQKQKLKPISVIVVAVGLGLAVLIAFLSGWLAVRWGSTDGSIPTAMRLILIQTGYLVVTASLCRLVLMMSNKSEAFSVTSATAAGLYLSWSMIPALAAYFLVSLYGAYIAHRRFSASPNGFPDTW